MDKGRTHLVLVRISSCSACELLVMVLYPSRGTGHRDLLILHLDQFLLFEDDI